MEKQTYYRAQDIEGKWLYGLVFGSLIFHQLVHDEYTQEIIQTNTIGEFVYKNSKGKPLFTGDVLFEEIEQDEGDVRLFYVLVWLPERLCYSVLEMGEYIAHKLQGAPLDEGEYYQLLPEELDKYHYKGTIYDKNFGDWLSGPA